MNSAEEVAKILLSIEAVILQPDEPFTYVSGIKSPIYSDNRLLLSYPEERTRVKGLLLKTIEQEGLSFDIVAGCATAGIPHATLLADALQKPMVYVRTKVKGHGKQNTVEGNVPEGSKVLVVEDLISTGGSSLYVVEMLREYGAQVDTCLALFTYELAKAKQNFADKNVRLIALSNVSTLLDVAIQLNKIKPEHKEMVMDWQQDPETWGKKHGFVP